MIIPVKYKLGGPLIWTVRFKPASKLRLFHNAITSKEYQHALNAPESVFDEDLVRTEIEKNWKQICDPYAIVSQIMEEGKGSSDTISFEDIQYISKASGRNERCSQYARNNNRKDEANQCGSERC